MMLAYVDGQTEAFFPDKTCITTHSCGTTMFIRRDCSDPSGKGPVMPSVEMDVEMDDISRGHAKGLQVGTG